MNVLKNELLQQNWDPIYNENYTNIAYDKFLGVFKTLYDKNCPTKQYITHKYKDNQWMSKGLQNACKKKTILYREFIKHRNKKTEGKYKKYKSKLTNIMSNCKKDCYNNLLDNNKNNIKGK